MQPHIIDQMGETFAKDVYLEDDPHRAALEDNPDRPAKLTWSTILAIFFLGLSFVAPVGLGFLLVNAIIFQIGTELGDTTSIVWIPGGWSIASSVSFSIAGSLSDVFGRRYVTMAGQSLALIGAIVGATAKTTSTVIAAGVLLGFAAGMIFVTYAGIPELLPNKWRNIGLSWTEGAISFPWAICSVIIATEFASKATWRWCYYCAIIYAAICLIGTALLYFPPPRPRRDEDKSRWQEIKEIDYIGIFLYTSGLTIFLLGLTWAGSAAHPWRSASVIAPIVLGVGLIAACFLYDFNIAKQPFFPLDLFRRYREFTVLLVCIFVTGMVYYSMASLLPQATLYMFENDPIQIGLTQLPNGFSALVGGVIIPAFAHKIGHLKIQLIVALTVQMVFVALYSVTIPHNKAAWMALQFFGQAPFGMITLLCYFISGLHVPLSRLGIAAGLIGTFRSGGGSVGNAIFNTILTSCVTDKMPKLIATAAIAQGFPAANLEQLIPATVGAATGVPHAFAAVEGATPAVQAAALAAFREAYGYGFKRVFWATTPFGVFAIIAACFVLDPSQYMTNHTAVRMGKDVVGGHTHHVEFGAKHSMEKGDQHVSTRDAVVE